jgi:predicted nuclease of predicted toxin-antitoxin system
VRFLLDATLSPRLVEGLLGAGYAARHIDQIRLLGHPVGVRWDGFS